MKKSLLATALFAGLAITGTANAYQSEVGGNYSYLDPEHSSGVSQFGVNGTYYFNPVQTRNSPLAEAAFLDKASNVNGVARYGNNDGVKNSTYGAGAEYYVPNSQFYVGAGIARNEISTKNTFVDQKTTLYNAEVGYLPAPGLLVAVGVQGYDVKNGDDGADPTLRAKLVTQMGQHDVNLEARGVFGSNNNRQYYVGGDYYIDKTFSVGADYTKDKSLDQDQWGLKAKKFVNPNLSVDGRLGFGDDYNTYTVGASYRF
ncbi:putative porin [Acinetobacter sp. B5B]|uniref:putative porin n=1 Tax=Acinetobacter baretiae TaxID=2605383 RepID=UPI0018C2FA7B|nr:putative porin [Acinetobacter baretiae]MBF7682614.1 putative porin [Acinetobacter baretiae]MBF7685591.1 putative porin [Acinetobacter baretiae]